ncbi:MAG TPA: helix-hairpin-helix domain-containing protein [Thermoanaerobaculia bacterium]|nr:helix-hairpin-helix domain-containing protein [Thermoanaerobaculia bacterium]
MRKSHIAILTLVLVSLCTPMFADDAPSSPAGVVNINTADTAQLSLLPRIGPVAAQRIVDYRKENGAFKKTADLMQVKGIGAKTFEGLASHVTVEGKTTLTEKVKSPRKSRASSSRQQPASAASN